MPVIVNSDACEDVSVIFARGSGQNLGEEEIQSERPQAFAFYNSIQKRLPKGVTHNLIELNYPAVGVGKHGVRNTIEAEWSWAGRPIGGGFNQSVDAGVKALKQRIKSIKSRCKENPDHRIVLGGYSQGANVVGNALMEMDGRHNDSIIYAGLFGDPKFDGSSYAARGAVKNKYGHPTYGVRESRENDYPMEYYGHIESWCHKGDGICETSYGNLILEQGKHTDVYQYHEIPLAAQTVVQLLEKEFPERDFDTSDPELDISRFGKLDLMLVVDGQNFNSREMDIADLRRYREDIFRQAHILSSDVRTGLVGYHSFHEWQMSPHLTYQELSSKGTPMTPFLTTLATFSNHGKHHIPNLAMQKALSQEWRPDAKKIIVVVANLRAKDEVAEHTFTSVLDNAQSQNIAIFPVTPEYLLDAEDKAIYHRVAQTNGLPFWRSDHTTVGAGRMMKYMLTTMAADRSIYQGYPYRAAPGETIRFNLAGFHGESDNPNTHYRWYFQDGRSTFTNEPVVTHAYQHELSRLVRVEITENGDFKNRLMVPVEVREDYEAPQAPESPSEVKVEVAREDSTDNTQAAALFRSNAETGSELEPELTAKLSWTPNDIPRRHVVSHVDGSVIGITDVGDTEISIADIPFDKIGGLRVATVGETAVSTSTLPQHVIDRRVDQDQSGDSDDTDETSEESQDGSSAADEDAEEAQEDSQQDDTENEGGSESEHTQRSSQAGQNQENETVDQEGHMNTEISAVTHNSSLSGGDVANGRATDTTGRTNDDGNENKTSSVQSVTDGGPDDIETGISVNQRQGIIWYWGALASAGGVITILGAVAIYRKRMLKG